MKEFVEKLIGRLEEYQNQLDTDMWARECDNWYGQLCNGKSEGVDEIIEIVNQLAEEMGVSKMENTTWIPCSERLPTVETKVLILAKRKYRDGSFKNIITTAMYEDGTMLENDSRWRWEDIEGKWDEENDCYIIPEGWWEDKMYNADGELNHLVDDEVLYWQPLPQEPYQKGE